jgi:uroporphyrinogen-III synthase
MAELVENTAESEENKMSRLKAVIVDTICAASAQTTATILPLISPKFIDTSR